MSNELSSLLSTRHWAQASDDLSGDVGRILSYHYHPSTTHTEFTSDLKWFVCLFVCPLAGWLADSGLQHVKSNERNGNTLPRFLSDLPFTLAQSGFTFGFEKDRFHRDVFDRIKSTRQ